MSHIFLHNTNNILGKSLIDFFLKDENNVVSILNSPREVGPKDGVFLGNSEETLRQLCCHPSRGEFIKNSDNLKAKMQDENIFVFNTEFFNEIDLLNEDYATKLSDNLNEIFKITNNICKFLIETGKKGKFIFITVNPSLGNTSNFPIAPINDEAIHSFVRSLAKEMTPFKIIFNVICIDPIFEMLDKEQLRQYRRRMKVYAIQKSPTRISEFLDAVKYVSSNNSHLFSGKIYYIGEGM